MAYLKRIQRFRCMFQSPTACFPPPVISPCKCKAYQLKKKKPTKHKTTKKPTPFFTNLLPHTMHTLTHAYTTSCIIQNIPYKQRVYSWGSTEAFTEMKHEDYRQQLHLCGSNRDDRSVLKCWLLFVTDCTCRCILLS